MKKKLILFGLLILFASSYVNDSGSKHKVFNVERVLQHETNRYTFLVSFPNTDYKGELKITSKGTQIITDVKESEKNWLEFQVSGGTENPAPAVYSQFSIYADVLTIHLHNLKEIDGAGWNHGKQGSGQTVVVE